MPLEKGSSQETIHANIKELIDSGKSKKQAVAISYKEAGMATDTDFDQLEKLFNEWLEEEKKEPEHAMDKSARSYDANNHLRVNRTVITKAAVNPYLGSSIPNHTALGLDPDKEYMLLRDPDELRKALSTFEGLQLLIRHIPVDAQDSQRESTIGSIGTDITMDDEGKVYSSLRVFDQEGIDYIESKALGELSAGYAYTADMTSGTFNGEQYDGIMRNIHGNHVAIVERGRIGSDAIIADSIEGQLMAKKITLKKGALAKLQTQLGMDSVEDVKKHILAVHDVSKMALDEKDDKKAEDEDDEDKKAEDEEVEIVEDSEDDKKAEDEDEQTQADKDNESEAMRLKRREKREEEDRTRDKKQAQDSASIEQRAVERVTKLFEAKAAVRPIVGEIACDSAEDAYKIALKQMGHSVVGVHPSAYQAMYTIATSAKSGMAQDSAPKARGTVSEAVSKQLARFGV